MNMAKKLVIQKVFCWYSLFYIYAKQRSKCNSGKINYSYLLNKIVVRHMSRIFTKLHSTTASCRQWRQRR